MVVVGGARVDKPSAPPLKHVLSAVVRRNVRVDLGLVMDGNYKAWYDGFAPLVGGNGFGCSIGGYWNFVSIWGQACLFVLVFL